MFRRFILRSFVAPGLLRLLYFSRSGGCGRRAAADGTSSTWTASVTSLSVPRCPGTHRPVAQGRPDSSGLPSTTAFASPRLHSLWWWWWWYWSWWWCNKRAGAGADNSEWLGNVSVSSQQRRRWCHSDNLGRSPYHRLTIMTSQSVGQSKLIIAY